MKKFLLKATIYSFTCFVITSMILIYFGGYVDFFYTKFTTPKAKSMIIGGSRSMQGLQPKILDKELQSLGKELPFFNYSFTVSQAPIGTHYNKSIFKKLDSDTKNGIFIISITPWMLANEIPDDGGEEIFREVDQPPHNMVNVSMNPNYEYFLKNLSYFHFKGIFRQNSKMHKDGWLEQRYFPEDSATFLSWKKTQKDMLLRFVDDYQVSKKRLQSLEGLLISLKEHGKVFIVRTPIDDDFLEIENTFFTDFDVYINEVCNKHDARYFNFNNGTSKLKFKTYDGHHLDKEGSKYFSKIVSDSIKSVLKV
ncbi:hypothetical protein [Aquimarina sp. 2304DJ70-9]|uniref:hypothetical protein n=1 Tax=Aquimarina penaris TaxID=3231044 RepID=UPI0034619010